MKKKRQRATLAAAPRDHTLLWAVLLALSTLLLYAPALGYEFVNLDDDHYILRNPALQGGLSLSSVVWSFGTFYGANWFPLTWLSWLLDVSLFGFQPWGFHLTNVLLHAASVGLLLLGLGSMTGRLWPSLFVAALFAAHPLHVESVAWVAARKDVLSGLFFMLALLGYRRYTQAPSRGRMAAVGLALGFGLMSKPTLVVLPFVLLLLDAWPLQRLSGSGARIEKAALSRAVVEKWPLFLLAAAASAATYRAQSAAEAVQSFEAFSPRARVLNALLSYGTYLRQSVWPDTLCVYYPHPGEGASGALAALALALLVAVTLVAATSYRRAPALIVGWLFFLGTLVPVIGLVQVGAQAHADRYMYLPLIGLGLMAAFGGTQLAGSPSAKRGLAAAACVTIAACAAATTRQLAVWRDSVSLFSHALAVTQDNVVAELNLGVALSERGRFEEAEGHLREAVRLEPGSAEALAALGETLARQSRGAEAEERLRAAVRLDPRLARGQNNLGRLLLEQGHADEAILHFREAIAIEPSYAEPYSNLGGALLEARNYSEAIEYFKKAVALDPGLAEAANGWGVALLRQGELDGAIQRFQEAVRLQPGLANAHQNWALALARRHDFEAAAARYQEALRHAPDDPASLAGLGLCLAHLGRFEEAARAFDSASRLQPDDPGILTNWGMALASLGQPGAAIDRYRAALERNPRYAEAHNGLGKALGNLGRLKEALAEFQRAVELEPGFAEAYNNLGLALASLGRHAEAVARLRHAVSADPEYADARNNLGVFLARVGQFEEAKSQFRETLRIDPARSDARANLERLEAAGAR